MFSRNKRQQKASPIKPPVRPMPKEPVLAPSVPLASDILDDDEPTLGASPDRDRDVTPGVARVSEQSGSVTETGSNASMSRAVPSHTAPTPSAPSTGGSAIGAQKSPVRGAPDSQISDQLTVVGNIATTGALALNGRVSGDITADAFELGELGVIDGTVTAQHVSISGTVNGAIIADSVALTRTARVNGDIEHRALSIETGAELNGAVRRSDKPVGGKVESDDKGEGAVAPAIELRSEEIAAPIPQNTDKAPALNDAENAKVTTNKPSESEASELRTESILSAKKD